MICALWTLGTTLLAPEPTMPELAGELAWRVKIDQESRDRLIELMKRPQSLDATQFAFDDMQKSDRENTSWLKVQVEKYGWPTASMVGTRGSSNAWLLVQHADHDRKFQLKCLKLMEPLVAKREVRGQDYAYLLDRVLVADGKKQKYGTQASTDRSGRVSICKLEDPKNIDRTRASVGLPPMKDYVAKLQEVYGRKVEYRPWSRR